jgi:hypothetical protein
MERNMLTSEAAEEASIDELLQRLASSEKGLSTSEAEGRLQLLGAHTLDDRGRGAPVGCRSPLG